MVYAVKQTAMDRFRQKVRTSPSGCVLWTEGKSKSGYAKFFAGGRDWRAHRWIWEQTFGKIPDKMQLDHTCNTRHCVNVEHLRVVTSRENIMADHSNTSARLNTLKTECPKGHPYTEWNTYYYESSGRVCKACVSTRRKNQSAEEWLLKSNDWFAERSSKMGGE